MNFLSRFGHHSETIKKSVSLPKLKSSITIYLSLMLVVIIALICTLIESGRVSAVNARLRSITYMAADSVFAEFAQPVFDQYGVMLLWMDEEEFAGSFQDYVIKNLNINETGAGFDLDLYGMQYTGSEVKTTKWVIDNGAQPFADQVTDYMKIHAIEGIAETLLSRSDFFEQTETVRELMGNLNQYQQDFADVENKVTDLYTETQRLKDLSENPKTFLEEIDQLLTRYENGDDSAAEEYSGKKQALSDSKEELSKTLTSMEEKTHDYYQAVTEAKDSLTAMKEEFDLDQTKYDPEIYQAVHSKLQEIEDLGGEEGQIYSDVTSNLEAMRTYQTNLNGLDSYFAMTQEPLTKENAGYYRQLTEQYQDQLSGLELSQIGEGALDTSGPKASGAFIRNINKTYQAGLLDLFADGISDKSVDKSAFPSGTGNNEQSTDEEEGFVDKTTEKALFCEYIREHFGCYTHVKPDSALDYEAEYILNGKDNDRDNLSATVLKLVLLRSGTNLISLLMDSEKQAAIHELAISIIGSTGQIYLIKIVEMLTNLVWALAEAMVDVRSLLHGKRIALLKQSDDWFFSLEGIQNFSEDEIAVIDNEGGLNYEEYLLTLLLTQTRQKQRFRTMDIIQANMCKNENEQFRIKDCLVGVGVEVTYTANSVFSALPVVRRTVASGGGTYSFQFLQNYTY